MSMPAPRTMLLALALPLAACGSSTTPATQTTDAATAADSAAPTDSGSTTATDTGTPLDTGTVTPADAGGPTDAGPVDEFGNPPVVVPSCDALAAGTVNGFTVDSIDRQFILTLPRGATAPSGHWPVVFNWHGLGDTAANMNGLLAGAVNNASMPFILVTPESTHLLPTTSPIGIEWDNIRTRQDSRDARFFDAVLQCLDSRWGVDRDRVYTVGFSAGAIMSDLLGVLRGSQIAAVVSFSGGYFSDPMNPPTLGPLSTYPQWPALAPAARYSQLVVYGGTADMFSLAIAAAHFNQFAANDIPYLNTARHDVVACGHGGGHTIPTGVQATQIVEFLAAHPRTVTSSPWASALPADYPSYCSFHAQAM